MKSFASLRSERLNITLFQDAHISADYISWLNDPQLMQFSNQRFYLHNKESCQEYLKEFKNHENNLFLAVEDLNNNLLGTMTVYFDSKNNIIDLGILIGDKSSKRRGIGSEAWKAVSDWIITNLKPRKLTAGCMAVNLPMLKLMENIGMEPDGVRKNHILWNDQFVDLIFMALKNE